MRFVKTNIPKVVISGFLTGLAIMIFMGQLRYLQINDPNTIQLIVTTCVVLMAAIAMWIGSKKYKYIVFGSTKNSGIGFNNTYW